MTNPPEWPTARIGVVLPSVNTVVEPFFAHAAPAGVTVHAGRMRIGRDADLAAVEKMERHGRETAETLATCEPDVIVYACTASGLVRGREADLAHVEELTASTGVPCVSATDSVVQALHAVGATRISAASPYVEEIDRLEAAYFEAAGIEVVRGRNLGITDTTALARCTPAQLAELAHDAWDPDSDALFIACLNLRSHEVVAGLEAELGRPVVTATQAALWHALNVAGVREKVPGYGQLLDGSVAQ